MSPDWMYLRGVRAYALPIYQDAQRAYHNDWHVRNMLSALAERGVLTPALALAVWGHDLVYDSRAKDNEERSAEVFGKWLAAQGAPLPLREQVRSLILATKHAAPPQNREEALLIDADLSILGADAEAFATYDAGIRQEYQHVPAPLYKIGRRKVLQGFLNRPQIYSTPEFAGLEVSARRNIENWLQGKSA